MNTSRLFALWILFAISVTSAAASDVFLPRTPAISPDGQIVVFSFQGDLWRVSVDGGQARRLTVHEAYDTQPVFCPDGLTLAFASDRYGDNDIYLMPIDGGVPSRLTHAGTTDRPGAFSPDGQTFYFTSRRLYDFPMGAQVYAVPTTGGTPQRLVDMFGDEVATADGQTFIIAAGRVKPHRLRYRGSYQREIYTWTRGSDPLQLTDNRGYDTHPMVDGQGRIYWIGDNNDAKTANIYTMAADGSQKRQLTHFTEDGIRAASLSADGRWVVLERGTDLYVVDTSGGEPRRLNIDVADDALDNPVIITNKTADASELATDQDGDEFAMVIDGEVVLVNKELGGRATVAVPGPHRERSLSFRPGSADTLLLVTDRYGEDAICLLVSDDPNESNLRLARKHRLVQLTDGQIPAKDPIWSPDGKRILYTQGNANLHVMSADGSDDLTLFEHWALMGYCWSPDGQWVAFSRYDANFNSDILIVPSRGGDAINVTRHPDYDENPVWSADGRILAWNSTRHELTPGQGQQDVFALYLQREDHERTKEQWKILEKTRDKKKGKKGEPDEDEETPEADKDLFDEDTASGEDELFVKIDFQDIYLRARRITKLRGHESVVAVDPKGDRFYFTAGREGKTDLYSLDRFGEDRKSLTKDNSKPAAISLDEAGKKVYFLKGGKPSWVAADGGKVKSTDFNARLTIDRPAVRLQVLDEGWRQLRDQFYDANMHGVDWPALRVKYGQWVQKVAHDRDFGDVVNFMLGEVNASHMGYYPNWKSPGKYGTDGFLGLEFDFSHTGDGLLVHDVLPYGPCDKAAAQLQPGDVLLSVEGQTVSATENLYRALETRADLETWLTVRRDGDDLEFQVVPISGRSIWNLNYRRMENQNRAQTETLSDGRIGYVHIQGMGFGNVQRFEQNLFAAADGKEALVIDVRNNGGGWTTDLLLTILTQPEHAYTIFRDGEIGYPQPERQPFYRWSKPIVVICNEGSYSNAEIFSHAIKTIGRGPVVGVETGGNVISTGGFGNRYNGYIRLPYRGWYVWGDKKNPQRNHKNQEGVHELTGFLPDYVVQRTAADRLHGRDPQLEKAVQLMLEAADQKRRGPQREDHFR